MSELARAKASLRFDVRRNAVLKNASLLSNAAGDQLCALAAEIGKQADAYMADAMQAVVPEFRRWRGKKLGRINRPNPRVISPSTDSVVSRGTTSRISRKSR